MALNALVIIVRWSSLPELLPAHYDLEGNAGGTMPKSILLLYILIGTVITLIAYIIGHKKHKLLQAGLLILASGICLILFSSTMVALTSGTMPVFMLAEPVILLAAVSGFVVCIVKSRNNKW